MSDLNLHLALVEVDEESGKEPQMWVSMHDSREELDGDVSPDGRVLDWTDLRFALKNYRHWSEADLQILLSTFDVIDDHDYRPRSPLLLRHDLQVIAQAAFDMGRQYQTQHG